MTDMTVSQTILSQLGGNRFIAHDRLEEFCRERRRVELQTRAQPEQGKVHEDCVDLDGRKTGTTVLADKAAGNN